MQKSPEGSLLNRKILCWGLTKWWRWSESLWLSSVRGQCRTVSPYSNLGEAKIKRIPFSGKTWEFIRRATLTVHYGYSECTLVVHSLLRCMGFNECTQKCPWFWTPLQMCVPSNSVLFMGIGGDFRNSLVGVIDLHFLIATNGWHSTTLSKALSMQTKVYSKQTMFAAYSICF